MRGPYPPEIYEEYSKYYNKKEHGQHDDRRRYDTEEINY